MKKRILTGDRPTGKLHLGHYVGSLKNRIELQDTYETFIIVVDLNSLTTKPEPEKLRQVPEHTRQMLIDYLAVGLDPAKVTFFVQSHIEEIPYLALLLSMLVSVPELERIPTLKEVTRDLRLRSVSSGLLNYPVLMAADILSVRADAVPVGEDQYAHLELIREITRRFNRMYGDTFPVPEIIASNFPRLVGTDGNAKMSKSLDNAIYLSDDAETVRQKVAKMYTDPARVHGDEPGTIEGNPVFIYHDAFNPNTKEVADLKERYQRGTVKDVEVKERLATALNTFLDPIRERRAKVEKDTDRLDTILKRGTEKARAEAQKTLAEVKKAMGL
jgi:tryptophanyl-tRNA synthetase